jgi:hypothetical protein
MAGVAKRRIDAPEPAALVQPHRCIHAAQGFQVTVAEAETARRLQPATA